MVVGSGASGTQIAEELHRSGRKVILAVGRFHKTPRRYRGRDFYWWFDKLGYWHTPLASMPPDVKKLRFVVTAVDGGHDVDLRQYASDGIVLAGRLKSADQQRVVFHDDLEGTLTEADAWYDEFRHQMEEYADKCPFSNGLGQSELFRDGGSGSFGFEIRRLSTDVSIVAV